MNRLLKLMGDPWRILGSLGDRGYLGFLDDKTYLRCRFRAKMGTWPDLECPRTYSEKLQWLKLRDRDPLYTLLADKCTAPDWAAEKIGREHIIPLLGRWDRAEDIDFDSLPGRFVLKCNHDSNSAVICRDRSSFDRDAAVSYLAGRLSRRFFNTSREWAYKDIRPCVIAQQYMEDRATGELRDYKFFCFGGVPRVMLLASGRQKTGEDTCFDYVDMDYRRLDLRRGHPNSGSLPARPECFDEMVRLAGILSRGIPHVRVDFYQADGRVYFGEMTFYPAGGTQAFEPPEWDSIWGGWIDLEPVRRKYGAGTEKGS